MLLSWRPADDAVIDGVLARLPAGVARAHHELRAIELRFDGLPRAQVDECLRILAESGVVLPAPPSEEAVARLDPQATRASASWAAYQVDDGGRWAATCEHCGWSFEAEGEALLDERQRRHDRRVHRLA